MTLRLRVGAATDVGRVRSINQDSYLVLADKGLYVVADGMGGHQGGEVASKLAVDVLRATYLDSTADALAEAIADANERIHDVGEADPDLRGMGTTVVAAAVVPDDDVDAADDEAQLLVANVGDSRAYLFRGGDLTQLTEDHSMVADLLREGRISAEEAEVHPQRNIVTRVLGVYDQVEVDLWPVDAVRGDRLLLCSDGLFNEVAADQIAAVLRRLNDPQEAASELVRRALEGGGRDNVTVLVLDVVDDGGVAETASAALGQDTPGQDTGGRATDGPDLAGFRSARDHEPGDDTTTGAGTGRRARRRRRDRRRKEDAPRLAPRHLALGGVHGRGARGDRGRLRHDRVVRHEHLLRGLRPWQRRHLPGSPAARPALDQAEARREPGHPARRGAAAVPPGRRGGPALLLRLQGPDLRLRHRPRDHRREGPRQRGQGCRRDDIDDHGRPAGRADDDDGGARVIRAARRNTELTLILLGTLVTVGAYVLASLAQDAEIPGNIVPFLGVVLGLQLAAHIAIRKLAPNADGTLVPIAGLLNGIGYVFIVRLDQAQRHPQGLAGLQAAWAVIGMVGFIGTLLVIRRVRDLERYRWTLGLGGIALLLMPLVPGVGRSVNGAKIWVGIGPVTFQPAEFAKILLALFFASYLVEKRELLAVSRVRIGPIALPDLKHLGPVLLAWGVSMVVMVSETDLGTSMLFFALFLALLWVATERTAYLVVGLVLFGAGALFVQAEFAHVQRAGRRVGGPVEGPEGQRLPDHPVVVRVLGRRGDRHGHRARLTHPHPVLGDGLHLRRGR